MKEAPKYKVYFILYALPRNDGGGELAHEGDGVLYGNLESRLLRAHNHVERHPARRGARVERHPARVERHLAQLQPSGRRVPWQATHVMQVSEIEMQATVDIPNRKPHSMRLSLYIQYLDLTEVVE